MKHKLKQFETRQDLKISLEQDKNYGLEFYTKLVEEYARSVPCGPESETPPACPAVK